MIATGKVALNSSASIERNVDSLIGLEFVGFDEKGRRIMGICPNRGLSNIVIHDNIVSWVIPDEWTFEDAATVPCVYATIYYALYMRGKLKKETKFLFIWAAVALDKPQLI
ncbi:PREDICTED: fatty acid synthase-like [Dinoponera quadriceps]|uniref:Fatty acid synthase-like n=1 Tax=Dinoponera quadriceps TaxID=609295 RepID=A0A6P3XTB9_DINQU|nr:PREDICTED: fatty acid synthase-like [Dinoponera quadriceps]